MMDIVSQIIIGVCFVISCLAVVCIYENIQQDKAEATRCSECGHIPPKFDARFAASRAELDAKFIRLGWVRCSCGEVNPGGYD